MEKSLFYALILLLISGFSKLTFAGVPQYKDLHSPKIGDTTYKNPLQIQFGDPYILYDKKSTTYYMYGTGGGAKDGFSAYSSTDLVNWKNKGQVYFGNTAATWGIGAFWAPEVYAVKDKYYMFYSAQSRYNPTNELENFKIGVAVADSPEGPFKDLDNKPLFEPGYPVIDANVFSDADGRTYLYYSRCCYKHPVDSEIAAEAKRKGWYSEIEESWVYGVEIKPDFSAIIGEPVLLLRPPVRLNDKQAEWESRSVTSKEVNRRWTEGSFTFKKDGIYYMMYSANHFGGENYAVGYATSNSPLGPFKKAENNPVLQKNTPNGMVSGTGHNSVVFSPDGKQMFCVYHGRTEATGKERVVFIDKMEVKAGKITVFGPTTSIQSMPLSSKITSTGLAQQQHEIFFADVTIYVEDGKYYLTGTRGKEPAGFSILESDDLKTWKVSTKLRDSSAMILSKAGHVFGTKGFWAPQIFKERSTYYLAYTANEQTALAQSKSLFGPYQQRKKIPIDSTEKNIDPFIFKDDDGKHYLYHVRFDNGNYLWVAEFDLKKGKIKPETLTKCFNQTDVWEATPNYKSDPVMEGPTVLKLKGKYYLFYSANHFMNIDYSVGYAVADSPYGPWKKFGGNPIIHRSNVGENGAGHGDVFTGLDGCLYYVYHIHFNKNKVSPRRTRIIPLEKKWDAENGVYTFSVKPEKVIIPILRETK